MSLVSTQQQLSRQVELVVGRSTTPPDWRARLFVNNFTPSLTMTAADFVEASFGGYQSSTLDRGAWSSPAAVAGRSQVVYGTDPLAWTVTSSPQTVYGYYIVDALTGDVQWAERFAVPRVLAVGDQIQIDLVFYTRIDPLPQ